MIAAVHRFVLPGLVAGTLLAASSVWAGLFDGNPPGDFLPVEEAFSPSVIVDGDTAKVRWQIADDYYLYRHALKFTLTDTSAVQLGPPGIPDGEKHIDEFFGEVETYRNILTVTLPLIRSAPDTPLPQLEVRYQGCADAGLCYPPQTTLLDLGGGVAAPIASPALTGTGFVAEQDRLANQLGSGETIWTLISFLGLGILLAFTPCVLPMIPILSGIIVGRGENIGAGRGFALSSAYVLAMALAYTMFGVLAGLFGSNLQAALQSPWVLVPFALLFVLLALAMFGLYQLQMPHAVQTRLNQMGQGGGLAGAALMGFASALIVGPCLAPPLAGALLYIGSSGDAVLGGAALFALGIGMGLPLIILGTAGAGALPKAGPWMDQVKVFFGVILIGVAIWLLSRILPGSAILALWAILLAGYGVYLGALEPATTGAARVVKGGGVIALVYAAILLVGAAMGNDNPLRPLQGNAVHSAGQPQAGSVFHQVADIEELRHALRASANQDRAAIVDFYADWCVECVHMERNVFADAEVRRALEPVTALQVDVTAYDATDRELLAQLGVIGPPTILFYGTDGNERKSHRLIGEVDANGFIRHLQRALKSGEQNP